MYSQADGGCWASVGHRSGAFPTLAAAAKAFDDQIDSVHAQNINRNASAKREDAGVDGEIWSHQVLTYGFSQANYQLKKIDLPSPNDAGKLSRTLSDGTYAIEGIQNKSYRPAVGKSLTGGQRFRGVPGPEKIPNQWRHVVCVKEGRMLDWERTRTGESLPNDFPLDVLWIGDNNCVDMTNGYFRKIVRLYKISPKPAQQPPLDDGGGGDVDAAIEDASLGRGSVEASAEESTRASAEESAEASAGASAGASAEDTSALRRAWIGWRSVLPYLRMVNAARRAAIGWLDHSSERKASLLSNEDLEAETCAYCRLPGGNLQPIPHSSTACSALAHPLCMHKRVAQWTPTNHQRGGKGYISCPNCKAFLSGCSDLPTPLPSPCNHAVGNGVCRMKVGHIGEHNRASRKREAELAKSKREWEAAWKASRQSTSQVVQHARFTDSRESVSP